jgi:hypothetical protein
MKQFGKFLLFALVLAMGAMAASVGASGSAFAEPPDPCFFDW